MTVNFRGYVFNDAGDAVSGASVKLLETGTSTQEGSTVTTDSNGLWYFNESDQDRYDVEITSGSSVRRIRWDDQISLKEIDVRNNTGATTPAATFTNLNNATANVVAKFGSANTTRADNDEIYFTFELANSAAELTEFARITVVATDVTNGSEDGQIEFDVMKAGTLTNVWTLTSSSSAAMSFDMNVDSMTFGAGADTDITLTFDGNSADGVITWMEDEDYFKFSDDILMNSTERINFYDTAIYIYSSTDGQLDLVADTEIQIAATTIDINGAVALNGAITGATNITLNGVLTDGNYTFDTSGNVSGLGTVASGAITSSGIIKTDDATEATSTTDGSLQTDGGLSVVKDAVFGDDVFLLSDSAVFNMGAGNDFTITHDGTTGATLAGSPITVNSTGALTLDSSTDITLDAGGADIFLKDDGTLFGTLTNSSGELVIKSSSSGTTAATFAGADVTFAGAVQIDGNLTVTGTQTIVDTVTMNAANAVVFEGATADGYETTLTIIDPTADHTVRMPNQSGYLPVLAAASTTQISATPEELNVLDGVTAGTVSASLGVVVDSNKDIGSFRNITLTGELDAGSLDVSGDANIAGEVQTAGIGYTDGDNAITIADGGGITAAAGITSTAAANSFGATSITGALTLDGDLDFTGPQEISTSSTDLTLNPARNTILAKAAVMTRSELTIASGVITVTSNYHTIDTEGDASTDDLNTINGAQAGQFLFLQAASSGRDVTIKNGGGNIYTRDGADVTMTSTSTPLLLIFDGGSLWRVVGGQAGL